MISKERGGLPYVHCQGYTDVDEGTREHVGECHEGNKIVICLYVTFTVC
jgi:hypothetical protein